MKKRSMLALASLATGFVVAAVTPSHAIELPVSGSPATGAPDTGLPAAGAPGAGLPAAGAETKLGGVSVDKALDTVGRAINRETERAVNDAPHGNKAKKG